MRERVPLLLRPLHVLPVLLLLLREVSCSLVIGWEVGPLIGESRVALKNVSMEGFYGSPF